MIELFSADTPNGKKIGIMLEEIGYEYKVTKVDIYNDEQFKPDFRKISPFSKIPVIIDHDNKETVFESGAILIYLAEKSNKFYNKEIKINNNIKHEKLYRKDYKYNYFILIKYNYHRVKKNKGSAIFIHLTKNYKSTKGCIALLKKDFLIVAKLINKNSKILIN